MWNQCKWLWTSKLFFSFESMSNLKYLPFINSHVFVVQKQRENQVSQVHQEDKDCVASLDHQVQMVSQEIVVTPVTLVDLECQAPQDCLEKRVRFMLSRKRYPPVDQHDRYASYWILKYVDEFSWNERNMTGTKISEMLWMKNVFKVAFLSIQKVVFLWDKF